MQQSKTQKDIDEKAELMLLRYLDGECGFFEKIRAARLVSNCPAAKNFLEEMRSLGDETRRSASDAALRSQHGEIDLWDRISARIDQEVHAELFLGSRGQVKQDRSGWIERLLPPQLAWGLSGVAASVIFALVLVQGEYVNLNQRQIATSVSPVQGELEAQTGVAGLRSRVAPSVQSVSTTSSRRQSEIPVILRNNPAGALEVDWMRSDGRVHILHDEQELNMPPLFWIDPNPASISRLQRAERRRQLRMQDRFQDRDHRSGEAGDLLVRD
jgi:hypothetical protein